MAPLASLDLQRLLAAAGLEARMRLLAELCDAMADDVIGLLSGDGDRVGRPAVRPPPTVVRAPRAGTRKAVIPSASPWAACWRHAGLSVRAASAGFCMLAHSIRTLGTVDRLSPPRSVRGTMPSVPV